MSYVLLNPYLDGKQIASKKKNINLAAEEIWSDISTKIKNYIPKFYFTMQNSEDGGIHHMKVKEVVENDKVKYSISALKNKKYHANDGVLLDEIKALKSGLVGGRRHRRRDDSSSSSSSSSDDEDLVYKFSKKHHQQSMPPMMTLNYYPSIYGVRNILLPSFVGSFTPYVRINLPLSNSVIIRP